MLTRISGFVLRWTNWNILGTNAVGSALPTAPAANKRTKVRRVTPNNFIEYLLIGDMLRSFRDLG
jgi:hypothetical protein